ncbi:OsmC family protein [Moheibacter stercoris]|uniref:Organic hydroperoxide reductase OsmC/OhrA n=1 Tax=Moheibacter stercoris TaxID=1628251 RepID=A0ABV2LWZ6_9FLAO
MSEEHYYEVDVKWKEGRIGELSSPVLQPTIECATPPEFTNGVPNIWSPEHLFGAAINSCYMATFLAIAENFKLPFTSFECKTVCKLEMVDKKFQITEAVITPVVHLENNELQDKALRVLEKSKQNCLVTNSIKTEITVVPKFL